MERSFTAKYDDHDRLVQHNNSAYQYGLNGEVSRVETDEDWINYSYDVFGNLTNAQTPNKNIEYKTDGFNRRVIKSVNGVCWIQVTNATFGNLNFLIFCSFPK